MFLDPVTAVELVLIPENNIQLSCQLHSNLAVANWRFGNHTLHSNNKYYIYSGGLLILSASETDAGQYICDSVEEINGQKYHQTVAVYHLQLYSDPTTGIIPTFGTEVPSTTEAIHKTIHLTPDPVPSHNIDKPSSPESQNDSGRITHLQVAVAMLSLICLSLMGAIFMIWSRGHWECLKFVQRPSESETRRQSTEYRQILNRTSEVKLLGPESGRPCSANNNHPAVDFKGNGEHHFPPMANISSLDGLGYINDESEI